MKQSNATFIDKQNSVHWLGVEVFFLEESIGLNNNQDLSRKFPLTKGVLL